MHLHPSSLCSFLLLTPLLTLFLSSSSSSSSSHLAHSATPVSILAVAIYLPLADRLPIQSLFQHLKSLFGFSLIFKQLKAALILQFIVIALRSVYRTVRKLCTTVSARRRAVRIGYKKLSHASTFTEWQAIAQEIDELEGNDKWRASSDCELYEKWRLEQGVTELNGLIEKGDVPTMMFNLRGGLARSKYGLLHAGLFSKAVAGTKHLVEEYNDKVCLTLDAICEGEKEEEEEDEDKDDEDDAGIPLTSKERLDFFNDVRHGYGRTALILSGGAALGVYHRGVIKCLVEHSLLPRVLAGTSAGAIVAAFAATRTDEEILSGYKGSLGTIAKGHSGEMITDMLQPLHIFDDEGEEEEDSTNRENNFLSWSKMRSCLKVMTKRFSSVVSSKSMDAIRLNSKHLRHAVEMNIGDFTFQEAFNRTGRILNITVSPQNRSDEPRLLNYLTSPNVLIWSAVVCSCAVPLLYEPAPLYVRASDGGIRDESSSGALYVDGSLENDLPMQQLSEIFNVNHFIISQVNPHAFLLSSVTSGQSVWTGAIVGITNGILAFLKEQMKGWLNNLVIFVGSHHLSPLMQIRRGLLTTLLTQSYEGRDIDITINPWDAHRSIPSAFVNIICRMDNRDWDEWSFAAEKETWKHLAAIKSHCAVEIKLDQAVHTLNKRIRDENNLEAALGSPKNMGWLGKSKREDSFRQTRRHLGASLGHGLQK